jgi:heme-degrading monooxygenase HmoA
MGLQSEKADYCVVMRFDSEESWHAYNTDPAHRAAVRESIGRLAARRISVQFQV